MFTKAQALASMQHECLVIQNLATHMTDAHMDYRPTPGQRSLLELIQYLSVAAHIVARNIVTGNWDHAAEYSERSKSVTRENFSAAMDEQQKAVEECLADFDGAALAKHETSMPWGTPCTGGEALVNMCLKTLVAYRMQLFLYLKSNGVEIGTMECWAGMSLPPS
ncbi:MAG: hypothetical protein AAF581_13950 [Planctomycetota bacterium]